MSGYVQGELCFECGVGRGDRVLVAKRRLLRRAEPQLDDQACLEHRKGSGVGPCGAVEDSTDGVVVDAGDRFGSTQGQLSLFEGVGELSGQVLRRRGRGVGRGGVGPRIATYRAGSRSRWAGHGRNLGDQLSFGFVQPLTSTPRAVDSNRQHEEEWKVRVEAYRPKGVSEVLWAEVGPTVREWADTTAEHVSDIAGVLGSLTGLAVWATQSAGYPLEAEYVLNRDVIERYVLLDAHGWSVGTRGTVRSRLYHVAYRVLGPEAVPWRYTPLQRSEALAPYSDDEVLALRWWARQVSGVWQPHSLSALIVFCAGVGLRAEELHGLRGRDVQRDGECVMVNVAGASPRRVPVLASFEQDALRLARVVGDDRFVFRPMRIEAGSPNGVSNLVERVWTEHAGVPRPTAQRLRVTWLVWHLRSRTPLRMLADAAGVESLNSLARYLVYVPGIDHVDARRYLRGER